MDEGLSMKAFDRGGYHVRLAASEADVSRAKALRHRAFFGSAGVDEDAFDTSCEHVLIDNREGRLLGCFRILSLPSGQALSQSYSAQFYDLGQLAGFEGKMLEIGRFCLEPEVAEPDVLRIAWGALTRFVDEQNIKMLFGCASFSGVSGLRYQDSFALLRARHLAPECWRPRQRARDVFDFGTAPHGEADLKRGIVQMPPLLRSYLAMGGWVSDHAVIDREMGTMHVFTGLEVRAIPAARKRLLRALAA